MTTENTDAGIRILTKSLVKMAEQLRAADEQLERARSTHAATHQRLMAIRNVLDPGVVRAWHPAAPPPRETFEELAEKRMAELAELRQELANQGMAERVIRGQWQAMEERVAQALGSLESNGSAVARVHAVRRILRGEA